MKSYAGSRSRRLALLRPSRAFSSRAFSSRAFSSSSSSSSRHCGQGRRMYSGRALLGGRAVAFSKMPASRDPNRRVPAHLKPSCFTVVYMGFFYGMVFGALIGVIIGGVGGSSSGLRGQALLRQCGKMAVGSAGAFSFFMAAGSALRQC